MRQERYKRLKRMYDTKHMEDVCNDAIEAVHEEETRQSKSLERRSERRRSS